MAPDSGDGPAEPQSFPIPRFLTGYDSADGYVSPWLPTAPRVIDNLLRALCLGPNDVLLDLGCGDGRVCVRAAETSGCRAIGLDLDEALVLAARLGASAALVGARTTFELRDILKVTPADIKGWNVSVIVLFLLPDAYAALTPMLEHCLKTSAVRCVATTIWPMPAWTGQSHGGVHLYTPSAFSEPLDVATEQ